ncbi:MAG TPA: restriction endonuclease [Bacteroidales bacterium]|nr:restriction endonuclease [Bacteroidales bacterium]
METFRSQSNITNLARPNYVVAPKKPKLEDFGLDHSTYQFVKSFRCKIRNVESKLYSIYVLLIHLLFSTVIFLKLSQPGELHMDSGSIFNNHLILFIVINLAHILPNFFIIIFLDLINLNFSSEFENFFVKIILKQDDIEFYQNNMDFVYRYDDCQKKFEEEVLDFHRKFPRSKEFGDDLTNFTLEWNKHLDRLEMDQLERRRKLEYWRNMDGFKFEVEVADLFRKLGYSAVKTRGSGDGGVDIVLINKKKEKIYVQCKNYSGRLSPSAARDFYGVLIKDNVQSGYLICSGGFSENTKEWVKGLPIRLLDLNHILQLNEKAQKQLA